MENGKLIKKKNCYWCRFLFCVCGQNDIVLTFWDEITFNEYWWKDLNQNGM